MFKPNLVTSGLDYNNKLAGPSISTWIPPVHSPHSSQGASQILYPILSQAESLLLLLRWGCCWQGSNSLSSLCSSLFVCLFVCFSFLNFIQKEFWIYPKIYRYKYKYIHIPFLYHCALSFPPHAYTHFFLNHLSWTHHGPLPPNILM